MSTLRAWRKAQNPKISQTELAKMLGTKQPHISDVERDEDRVGLEFAARVFSVTGVRIGKMKDMNDPGIQEIARMVTAA